MVGCSDSKECNRPTKQTKLSHEKQNTSGQFSPLSFAVASVSSCKSWSTHGLSPPLPAPLVLPGAVEVVSVSRDFSSIKPMTRHKTTARTGVNTDRSAMIAGVQRTGQGHSLFVQLASAEHRLDIMKHCYSCPGWAYRLSQSSLIIVK